MNGRRLLRLVPDAMTVGNGLCGFLAITVLAGILDTGSVPVLYAAAGLVGLGTVLDALDGVAARWWGSTGRGGTLDLMSDAVTFVVAVAVLVATAQGPRWEAATVLAGTFLVFAGTWRLARNIHGGDAVRFLGVPVSWSGPTLTIAALAVAETGAPAWVLPCLTLLLAGLNVSRIPYPKTHGRGLTRVVVAIAVAGVAVVLLLVLVPTYRMPVLVFSALLAVAVVVFSPVLAPIFSR